MKQHISFPRSPVKFEGHTSQKKNLVKFGVSGHFLENAWEEWPGIYMLMYPDHFQNW